MAAMAAQHGARRRRRPRHGGARFGRNGGSRTVTRGARGHKLEARPTDDHWGGDAVVVASRALETKYRIAETAMALFLEQGYECVTVEAVADASQVSRRTVFRYFDGKDELAFPDHTERLKLLSRHLVEPTASRSPVEVVMAATEAVMLDFLQHPELVLRRYRLTRVVPELRKREVLENERYVSLTRAYLRKHLPKDSPPFLPMALSSLIDAMHRSALSNFARSDGKTDALGELRQGLDWVRQLLAGDPNTASPLILAVLPDSPKVRRALTALRDEAREELGS
uniref:HTH tetR-type domain-containing protein n=1 Tax=Thermocrispum agreste TaxID=37925 RepID=A0A2W4JYJ5_9PSEU|nr:MAG: hypothetical protein DIU77_06745 [Thermocrispum agreste]